MRLPTWDELVAEPEQLDVLEHPLDQSLFVAGPPGSGKTVLAIHRAQSAAQPRESDTAAPSVVIVTFNRMLRRLLTLMDESDLTVATMQSFVWKDYERRTGKNPPRHSDDPYEYDWDAMLTTLDGHARAIPDRQHLVVDEAQDLPEGFFRYASRHVSRTMTVFADEDQALKDRRSTLAQIKAAAGLADPVLLTRNHRNTPEVAALANHFHQGRLPAADVVRSFSQELPRLLRSRGPDSSVTPIANWFTNRGGSIGVIVDKNPTGSARHQRLGKLLPEARVDIYSNVDKNEDTIDVLKPGITVLNRESVKGQEFDTVFILELEAFIPCRNEAAYRTMYMMCARARDHLFLVYGPDELTPAARRALPGPDILEGA